MEEILADSSDTAPSFTYFGLNLFGLFLGKEGMKEVKRYGVIFTCLNSQVVHIDSAKQHESRHIHLATQTIYSTIW